MNLAFGYSRNYDIIFNSEKCISMAAVCKQKTTIRPMPLSDMPIFIG